MRLLLYWCLIILTSFITWTTQDQENLNKKVPYFTSTYFYCESHAVNTSHLRTSIESVTWILPDNTILKQGQMWKKATVSAGGYNITISEINDDVFGYYYCIVVMNPMGNVPSEVKSIQFGLNIDGADFSDLREHYRKSAIIGGIAAAVMAVVFGVGCLVWHYRYTAKQNDQNGSVAMKHESHIQAYDNAMYEMNADGKEVPNDEKVSPSDVDPNGEPVVVESVNIHTEKL